MRGDRKAQCYGGPLAGEMVPVTCPRLRVPSTPILKTVWDGEMFVHTFTIHEYQLVRGGYKYMGTTA